MITTFRVVRCSELFLYTIWFPGPEWGEARGWRGGGWRSDPSTLLLRGHDERHEQGDCVKEGAGDVYGGGDGVLGALGKPPLWRQDLRLNEQGDRVRGLLVLLLQGHNGIIERWPTLRLTSLPITRKCTSGDNFPFAGEKKRGLVKVCWNHQGFYFDCFELDYQWEKIPVRLQNTSNH